jgi:thiamine-phosphate diphosphorylase
VIAPRLLVLTDRRQTAGRPLVDVVRAAADAGAPAIVLREKDLDRGARAALAAELRAVLAPTGAQLLVASDATIESDGLHLAVGDPFPDAARRPAIVGRSCHSLAEVRAAEAEGCDYVTLSPIFESASKPGHGPALGLDGLRDVVDEVTIPVVALGGVDAEIADGCVRAGASGLAVMGEVMRAEDPGPVVRALVRSVAVRR